jgi:hypothetical protein
MALSLNKPKLTRTSHHANYFIPKNTYKYIGDFDKIIFRSSWEKRVFIFLDENPHIIGWASEPFPIPYMKPILVNGKASMRKANYFPDIYVEFIDSHGNEKRQLIEIKPEKQTKPSKSKKPTIKLQENYAYAVNTAKWSAATAWCSQHGIEFIIATEKTLFR